MEISEMLPIFCTAIMIFQILIIKYISCLFEMCYSEHLQFLQKSLIWTDYCSISALPAEKAFSVLIRNHLHQILYDKSAQVALPLWVFKAIKRTFPLTLRPIKTPHCNVQNAHLIESSLIPSNCVIRMDEITLNATWLNTDGGGQGECVGWTVQRTLNRQSDRLQEHYCFMHSNEIPRLLLLLRMNYVCVTVLICAGHHLWGNVGHMLMHNKRFRLYSHPQRGRLAPIFSSS